jgi:hypothetical protein
MESQDSFGTPITPTDSPQARQQLYVYNVDSYHAKIAKFTAKYMALPANYIPSAAYDATTNPAVTMVIKDKAISDPHNNLPYYGTP